MYTWVLQDGLKIILVLFHYFFFFIKELYVLRHKQCTEIFI